MIGKDVLRVAYIPQTVYIAPLSIAENVCLGVPIDIQQLDKVKKSLNEVSLLDYVLSLPEGLNSNLGDMGSRFSGGQRQRLGIARALYHEPDLLIMDEATSSLDADSENGIAEILNTLKGRMTTIVIAHRLSTVKGADTIFYLEKGRVVAQGTFDELRKLVPDFDRQAHLMGIVS